MQVVVSQSMYFPWAGLLEQVSCADVFVHYDDVQFTRGFCNRVQIKTTAGSRWMTVPLCKHAQQTRIDELVVDDSRDWRAEHMNLLKNNYRKAPFLGDALAVMETVLSMETQSLAEISRASMLALASYFGLTSGRRFIDSQSVQISGYSTERLVNICRALGANRYVTGHGAQNYLDHGAFESLGIEVHYMNYSKRTYRQLHGDFTPFVSALDLVANCGRAGAELISSTTMPWREFINGPK